MSEQKLVTLNITGMTCAACSARIEKVLNKMDGVEATVNLAMEKATIHYNPSKQNLLDIQRKIEQLGYGVESEKVTLDIEGMTCAACSARIEKGLKRTEGVVNATVNLATNSAVVEYREGVVSVEDLLEKIKKLGYKGQVRDETTHQSDRKKNNCIIKKKAYCFYFIITSFIVYNDRPFTV